MELGRGPFYRQDVQAWMDTTLYQGHAPALLGNPEATPTPIPHTHTHLPLKTWASQVTQG